MLVFLKRLLVIESYLVWDPHYFRGRVLMLKLCTLNELALFFVKHNNLDLVRGVLNERPHRESDVLFRLITEVD